MYDPEYPTFVYRVNTEKLKKDFKEFSTEGKYITYVSKDFYGAVIRSRKSLLSLDHKKVVMSVRLKGRNGGLRPATGIKIDLIEIGDPRIKKYGIEPYSLSQVEINVSSNIPNNIILNREPALLSAYFYKKKDGSSFINFVQK